MSAVNPQSIERDRLEEKLNEALEESFPASDPPALMRAPRDDAGAMSWQPSADSGHASEKRPGEARQGVTGLGVRYVLEVGILLAVMAGVILYFLWWK
jgi:hypothetical protein